MAGEAIIKLTRGVPKTDREWMDVFSKLTKHLKVVGDTIVIEPDIQLPDESVTTNEIAPNAVTEPKLGDDSVTNRVLRDSSALSVIGRPVNSGGNPSDIVSTAADTFLVRRGAALTWDALADADIPANVARDSEVSAAITAHEAAPDPHSQYTTASEVSSSIAALNLTSGVYTPTLTNVTNVDDSTPLECQYLRVGSTVHVSGFLLVNPSAAAATELRISLPIASSFASNSDCGGVAAALAVNQSGGIIADSANDAASLQFVATDTAERAMAFSFSYQLI